MSRRTESFRPSVSDNTIANPWRECSSVIFVAGVLDHPYNAWQSPQLSSMWIRDWLASDLIQSDDYHSSFTEHLTQPAKDPDAPIRRPRIMIYRAKRDLLKAWWMHGSSQITMRAEDISESPVISRDHLECVKKSRAHLVCFLRTSGIVWALISIAGTGEAYNICYLKHGGCIPQICEFLATGIPPSS